MNESTPQGYPAVAVVIPSWSAERNANLKLLLEDIESQTVKPAEIKIVERTSPNGHARNVGVQQTAAPLLVFLDDDVRLASTTVFEQMVQCLTTVKELGMTGTSQQLPPDASRFQQKCAQQLSRSMSDIVPVLTDSDMVTTQCCALRRAVLEEVGGFHDRIRRGVDPELRHRVRLAGYRVAVAPNIVHYHPMPATLRALLKQAWRDGGASAFARKHFPETVLYNPEGHVAQFQAKKPFPLRVISNLSRLLRDCLTGKWYGTIYGLAYAAGNLYESFHSSPAPESA